LQTVRVRGEVLYPSTIRYDIQSGFKDIISKAGGFTDQAKPGKAYVIYANGSAKRTRKFFWFNLFPRVEPGAELIIPTKPEKKPLPAQVWISLATGTSTLALVIQQLVNN
jgi:protein involved in polysaccharide export with SLBB domain